MNKHSLMHICYNGKTATVKPLLTYTSLGKSLVNELKD